MYSLTGSLLGLGSLTSISVGGGVINGYDSQGNVVITEELSGYIQQTSIQCDLEHGCFGTFNVIPNHEPCTLGLALVSAGAFVVLKAARRRRR
jgi:hypothetical protein